ncbi:unnamed protein product [Wuchereria bancrofti]|uniref:Uncharacterized protein n=1 Tax=Wuchereria bancrofti TaxID=6293 RepID=A0A3P7G6N3_WUCBA|nr:unnamed protein product [Wuchereria bancrofti]
MEHLLNIRKQLMAHLVVLCIYFIHPEFDVSVMKMQTFS